MKICNRDYDANTMLSVTEINGIKCCPNCEKPVICHNRSVIQRALIWALSKDTGVSSSTLCSFMTGAPINGFSSPPSDASDRGRCIRLLELIPEWIPRLPELVALDTKKTEGIVISSSGMSTYSNSWADQIPLIIKEGSL